jgi:hypothetical protein
MLAFDDRQAAGLILGDREDDAEGFEKRVGVITSRPESSILVGPWG